MTEGLDFDSNDMSVCLFSPSISWWKGSHTFIAFFSEYYVMTCKTHSYIVG